MKSIVTLDDLRRSEQEARCRSALKVLDCPEQVYMKLEGPILFQMAHLCAVIDEPMHWRDALRWCWDHRGEIIEHARQLEIEKMKSGSEDITSH